MYTRHCPVCSILISYTKKYNYNDAIKKNRSCKACASKKFVIQYATKGKNCGSQNSFYGKQHTNEMKKALSKLCLGRKHTIKSKTKMSKINKGKNNPMYGKTVYQTWVEKHGIKEADRRMNKLKIKHSKNSKGKNNPMYGKPSPTGSGNGWKGWYKGTFFRSLLELTFLTSIFDKEWHTGETLVIPYGIGRTYRPDFIIGNQVIEIKPKKLHRSTSVQLKATAAKRFCKKIGKKYCLIDPGMLKLSVLDGLVTNGDVIFHERYQSKYTQYKHDHIDEVLTGCRKNNPC